MCGRESGRGACNSLTLAAIIVYTMTEGRREGSRGPATRACEGGRVPRGNGDDRQAQGARGVPRRETDGCGGARWREALIPRKTQSGVRDRCVRVWESTRPTCRRSSTGGRQRRCGGGGEGGLGQMSDRVWQLEEYYQQAGRCGRDGSPATAVMFVRTSDWSKMKGCARGEEEIGLILFQHCSLWRHSTRLRAAADGQDRGDATMGQ